MTRAGAFAALVALIEGCSLGVGLEPAGELCRSVTCDAPSHASCLQPGTLREYRAPGRCRVETGQCEYPFSESTCALGCFDDSRCRREGDPLWETPSLGAWALEPGGVVAFAAAADTGQCEVFRVRRFAPPEYREVAARETGCADGRSFKSAWPSVTADGGLVLRWSALNGTLSGLAGLWLIDGEGARSVAPRPTVLQGSPPAVALDPSGRIFVATHGQATALEADGGVAWTRACGGPCDNGTFVKQGSSAVVPGRAYVACLSGCAAFAPEDGRSLPLATTADVALMLVDGRSRVLVGSQAGGLEAFAVDSADAGARFFPVAAPATFAPVAAVVEQGGSVLLAWASQPASSLPPVTYSLSRLAAGDLSELARIELPCRPGELAARADGSTLLTVACPDTHPERGAALWALDEALAVQWKSRVVERTTGALAIGESGEIAVQFGSTFSVRVGAQPPARSAWPMRGANARYSWASVVP